MRKPRVENKYNLTIDDIKKLEIGDRSKFGTDKRFWRNNVINAWCMSRTIGSEEFCDETEYWMGFYDKDAEHYPGKFRISFSTYGGMCGYNFKKFFQPEDIDGEDDLRIQELFLEAVNGLLDDGILVQPKE